MRYVVAILVVAAVIGLGVAIALLATRRRRALTADQLAAVKAAAAARRVYRSATSARDARIKAAQKALNALTDPKGARISACGGATLYERWIDTPQGGGSLVGVKAQAADESSVRQRLTATRMLTFGIFALAAPKKKGVGNAYVVIEGPGVSGVAILPAKSNTGAGPAAFAFAAKVNNAARIAEQEEPLRPSRIHEAEKTLASAQSTDDVDRAREDYRTAAAAVPESYRSTFPAP